MTSRPLRSAASTFAVYAVLSAVPVVALGLVLNLSIAAALQAFAA